MSDNALPDSLKPLKEQVDKLQALLDDPEPGLFTWRGFLDDRVRTIVEFYYEHGGEKP